MADFVTREYFFLHKMVLNIVSTGKEPRSNKLWGYPYKNAPKIKNGICFSLVCDWLYNFQDAQGFYWKCVYNTLQTNKSEPDPTLTPWLSARFNYYLNLADRFCDYTDTCTAVFGQIDDNSRGRRAGVKEIEILLKHFSSKENYKRENVLDDVQYLSINNIYLQKYYNWKFSHMGTQNMASYYDKAHDADFLGEVFGGGLCGRMLVNILFYSLEGTEWEQEDQQAENARKNGTSFQYKCRYRHSIGIIKTKKNEKSYPDRFLVFDPNFGVFTSNNVELLFTMFMKRYESGYYENIPLMPVFIQYQYVYDTH